MILKIIQAILAAPKLLELLFKIEKKIEDEKQRQKIDSESKEIDEAFDKQDPQSLRDIFNRD
jgi:hypothetical protein